MCNYAALQTVHDTGSGIIQIECKDLPRLTNIEIMPFTASGRVFEALVNQAIVEGS